MVELAVRKAGMGGATIILLDADDDCPAVKGAELKQRAESIRSDGNFKVILAKVSLSLGFLLLPLHWQGIAVCLKICLYLPTLRILEMQKDG